VTGKSFRLVRAVCTPVTTLCLPASGHMDTSASPRLLETKLQQTRPVVHSHPERYSIGALSDCHPGSILASAHRELIVALVQS
jgi:hypothetical protein